MKEAVRGVRALTPTARRVLALLVVLDACFVVAHVAHIVHVDGGGAPDALIAHPRLSLAWDRGFGELYGYLKLLAAVIVLVHLSWRTRIAAFLAWAGALTVVLADDALMVHERLGRRVVAAFDLQPALGLRAQDFGELTVWGALGIVTLACIAVGHLASPAWARRDSAQLLALLVALAFFGLVADMVHSMVEGWLDRAMAVVEDGGELVVISAIVAVVIRMAQIRAGPGEAGAAPLGADRSVRDPA